MPAPMNPDPNDRLASLVRVAVLGWSAALLTLSYMGGPKADQTFIASVFSASMASFGLASNNGSNGNSKPTRPATPISKRPAVKKETRDS